MTINENLLYKQLVSFDEELIKKWDENPSIYRERFLLANYSNIVVNSIAILIAHYLKCTSFPVRSIWARSMIESLAILKMDTNNEISRESYKLYKDQLILTENDCFSVFLEGHPDKDNSSTALRLKQLTDPKIQALSQGKKTPKTNLPTFFLNKDKPPKPSSIIENYLPDLYKEYNFLGLLIHPFYAPKFIDGIETRLAKIETKLINATHQLLIDLGKDNKYPLIKSLSNHEKESKGHFNEYRKRRDTLKYYFELLSDKQFDGNNGKEFFSKRDPGGYCLLSLLGQIGYKELAISAYKPLIEMEAIIWKINQIKDKNECHRVWLLFSLWSYKELNAHSYSFTDEEKETVEKKKLDAEQLFENSTIVDNKIKNGMFSIINATNASFEGLVQEYLKSTITESDDLYGRDYSSYKFSVAIGHGFGLAYNICSENLDHIFLDIDNWADEMWIRRITAKAKSNPLDANYSNVLNRWALLVLEKRLAEAKEEAKTS
jgi:hypothetical protein